MRRNCFSATRATVVMAIVMLMSCVSARAQRDEWPSFLPSEAQPDGTKYLPAPPDTMSLDFMRDFYYYQWGKSMRQTERGKQAADDADQSPMALCRQFSEAFGMTIDSINTPELYRMIELLDSDCGYATRKAKRFYQRKRPYVQFNETTSVPSAEETHRRSGSYPSGHSSTGWGIALVLAEINPERQEEILKRGYEIGESRIIAGYHYKSDVEIARLAGSASIARLHADEGFQRQLKAAKKEFLRLQKNKKN